MIHPLYHLATWAAQPLLRRKLARRGVAEPGYLHAVDERFGRYTTPRPVGDGPLVWVHAVSLGETRAAAILLVALRARFAGMRLLLTHSTATVGPRARSCCSRATCRCGCHGTPRAP